MVLSTLALVIAAGSAWPPARKPVACDAESASRTLTVNGVPSSVNTITLLPPVVPDTLPSLCRFTPLTATRTEKAVALSNLKSASSVSTLVTVKPPRAVTAAASALATIARLSPVLTMYVTSLPSRYVTSAPSMVRFHRSPMLGVPVSFTVPLVYLVAKRPPLWLIASARPAATLAIGSGVEVPETALRVYS